MNYRDKAGKYVGYYNDEMEFGEEYKNFISKDNLLTKSTKIDLNNKKKSTILYKYFNFDKFRNPCKIILTELETKKHYKILIRIFEYD